MGDGHGVAALFGQATVKWGVGAAETFGARPMLELFERVIRLHEDGTPRTHHLITNPLVEIGEDGTSATCRSYYTVVQQTGTVPLQVIAGGRYHDWFAKEDGVWRFARREYFMDFRGDLRDHVKV
jgi:3-phenylpropionate/cinnamic acid dioxygenase small subunit